MEGNAWAERLSGGMIGVLRSQTGSLDKVSGGLCVYAWVASQRQEIGACGEAVITCGRFCAARPWMQVASKDAFVLDAGVGGQVLNASIWHALCVVRVFWFGG